MSLVEEFGLLTSYGADATDRGLLDHGDSLLGDSVEPSTSYELPLLTVDPTVRQAARGKGQVATVAVGNETFAVASSRGFVMLYSWDDNGNEKVTEVELYKSSDTKIRHVFVDPYGCHIIISAKTHNTIENHYLHKNWTKTRALNKLKGVALSAVGWRKQPQEEREEAVVDTGGRARSGTGEASEVDSLDICTSDILLGTETGQLHQAFLHEHAKKPAQNKLVFDFLDKQKAVCSVEQEVLSNGRRLVLVVTPGSMYVFTGGPTLEALFAVYTPASTSPLLESEQPSLNSRLVTYRPAGQPGALPQRFGWMVGGVLYHGQVNLGATGSRRRRNAGQTEDESVHLSTDGFLQIVPPDSPPEDEPTALVLTEYHFLVLLHDKLVAVNRVSGQVVQEVMLQGILARGIIGVALGLAQDLMTTSICLFSNEALHEVTLSNEGRDMWKIYLQHQDYDNALRLCSSPAQRDQVYTIQADAGMAAKDYLRAARLYGNVVGGRPPFEDIALQLVQAADPEALQVFLSTKLSVLGREDRAQATMVATWLTELYLDQINRALLEAGGGQTEKLSSFEQQLRDFLKEWVQVLDPRTTTTLLATYGRLDDLMHYASCRQDDEAVLEYLMQKPGGTTRALSVLRKPNISAELIYKFAPALITAAPAETVDFWISVTPPLDPRRILPALLRFGEAHSDAFHRSHVMRYIEFSVGKLLCQDSSVHNLAVALYSLEDDERHLLQFLERSRSPLGKPLFDPKSALRIARERQRKRSCVMLLGELGLYEDAVELALQVDVELAKSVASKPDEESGGLRRKLWLSVARHVVQQRQAGGANNQAASIKQAVDFLKEAGGLLKIEDILPFFPDFVTIDNFKEAICDSLERYNRQIDDLKREMAEATDIADAVRQDLKVLSTRTATLSLSEPCARCKRALAEAPPAADLPTGGAIPPFFLFPSRLAYHGVCCALDVLGLVGPQQQDKIKTLMQRLAKVQSTAEVVPAVNGLPEEAVSSLQAQLEDEIASECPRNGEVTLWMIDKPFISEATASDVFQSWQV